MSVAETPAEAVASDAEVEARPHEPSPYVEAVADEPTIPPAPSEPAAVEAPAPPSIGPAPIPTPSWLDEPEPRLQPLRFVWQMDVDGRFSLASDEFSDLIGARTAAGFGRLWQEIADAFALDPDGRVLKAIATRNTWSGITLNWPVDGGGQLPVELSGLPVYDRMQNFAGYRGFGVCRDLDGLARLAALRRFELLSESPAPQPLSADTVGRGFAGASSCRGSASNVRYAQFAGAGFRSDFTPGRFGNTRGYAQECPAVPARRRDEIACPDAGRKQRLRRARPAIVGAARQGDRRTGGARNSRNGCLGCRSAADVRKPPNRPSRHRAGLGARRPRPAANPGATGRCSICFRSAC